jgi:hypothetical protein
MAVHPGPGDSGRNEVLHPSSDAGRAIVPGRASTRKDFALCLSSPSRGRTLRMALAEGEEAPIFLRPRWVETLPPRLAQPPAPRRRGNPYQLPPRIRRAVQHRQNGLPGEKPTRTAFMMDPQSRFPVRRASSPPRTCQPGSRLEGSNPPLLRCRGVELRFPATPEALPRSHGGAEGCKSRSSGSLREWIADR